MDKQAIDFMEKCAEVLIRGYVDEQYIKTSGTKEEIRAGLGPIVSKLSDEELTSHLESHPLFKFLLDFIKSTKPEVLQNFIAELRSTILEKVG
jgi:hypothetical protein